MPAIESALVAIIKSVPAVTAVLGTPVTRFYPDTIPQGVTYPATAYQRITSPRITRRLNPDQTRQLVATTVQVTIHAKSAADRANVGDVLTRALQGRLRQTWAGVYIAAILAPSGERDTHNGETGIYERQIDFPIQYREA